MAERNSLLIGLAVLATLVAGCSEPQRINPSFAISIEQARIALRWMEADPKPLQRPLVILGGFSDPFVSTAKVRGIFRDVFNDPRIITVNFAGTTSFEQCRRRVIAAVQKSFPSDDPTQTIEVDVIGLSMGGLVARIAADTNSSGLARLRISRLFTISSPLQGAKLARYPIVLTSMHRDMREGSELLAHLNATPAPYQVFAYTRLNDQVVGERFAAPAGQTPWWVDLPAMSNAHFGAISDPRILADIARRLRGETPFATSPPAPLP